MPTTSDERRGTMLRFFRDPISEYGPIKFLKSHGFKLRRDWYWEKPTPSHTISDDEYECLAFLVEEWDFGGIHAPRPSG
jgi:hypothetical protein